MQKDSYDICTHKQSRKHTYMKIYTDYMQVFSLQWTDEAIAFFHPKKIEMVNNIKAGFEASHLIASYFKPIRDGKFMKE